MSSSAPLPARFSPAIIELLRKAGWHENRSVLATLRFADGFERLQAVDRVLDEFGGLHIAECGRGIDWAANDVQIDPWVCDCGREELDHFSQKMKIKLHPLGDFCNGHGSLIMDECGAVYAFSNVDFTPFLPKLAESFDDALDRLLLGKNWLQKPAS
ncbi:MAG TPA: SUKH-3 domain-containing protein [Chthoniobacteraceae bacterium]|nr:SUKH-3 domain-containing protein [Chthoniobacteraceae bacterium]